MTIWRKLFHLCKLTLYCIDHPTLIDSYPCHRFSKLDITKVNTYGIVITWKGADDSLKPYLFMAHQDVVPVPDATVSRWKYPPYSAHYDGRYIWGRGATDCKNNLIGVLEAFEMLLKKGFSPKRTILAGFGFDEEISGWQGAANIAKHLEEQWGRNSIDLIIDEGGLGIHDIYGVTFALPALGEKGIFNPDAPSYLVLILFRILRCNNYR
jgi:Gly-Xaa carboxypeptidase